MGIFYDASWGGTCVGRIEPDGKVYDESWGGKCIGRVESDGKVYDSSWGGRCIGRIDADGKIYNSSWGGNCVGRVQADGKVYDESWGGKCIGRVDNMCALREGAALRLLCIGKGTSPDILMSPKPENTANKSESVDNIPMGLCFLILGVIIVLIVLLRYWMFVILGVAAFVISLIFMVKKRKEIRVTIWRILKGVSLGFLVFVLALIVSTFILIVFNPQSSNAVSATRDAQGYIVVMGGLLWGSVIVLSLFLD